VGPKGRRELFEVQATKEFAGVDSQQSDRNLGETGMTDTAVITPTDDEVAALLRLHVRAMLGLIEGGSALLSKAALFPHIQRIEQLYLLLPDSANIADLLLPDSANSAASHSKVAVP
jgi:hypothetical protein